MEAEINNPFDERNTFRVRGPQSLVEAYLKYCQFKRALATNWGPFPYSSFTKKTI